ncbi:MAG: hypothetical protein WKF53_15335 [Rubrobacter sp.]
MSEDNAADAQYLFGHSEEETRRLLQQGRLFNPYTRRLLQDAGIMSGMKVLTSVVARVTLPCWQPS